jgi:hypothetical protein
MGHLSKRTKKFSKTKLKDEIKRRKDKQKKFAWVKEKKMKEGMTLSRYYFV